MPAFLRSLLVSASIISVAYFVWWGCFAPSRPCLTALADAPAIELQLIDDARGPQLRFALLECFEPGADFSIRVNGEPQVVPPELSNTVLDAAPFTGAEPVDLSLVLDDGETTWTIEIPDFFQARGYTPQATTVAAGDSLALDWTGAVAPNAVFAALVDAANTNHNLTAGGDLVALSLPIPSDAATGAATLSLNAELLFELTRCDGPSECILPPSLVNDELSITVSAP